MADTEYEFYMQAVDKNGTPLKNAPVRDLEGDFEGLRYCEAKGLNTIGKQRVYKETFVESESTNVYIPETPSYEPTTVNLVLYFLGEERYDTYNQFNDYIRKGFHAYWDSARERKFIFYIEDDISIDDEMWYGSMPYLKVTYKLQNIKGFTEKKS